MAFLSDWSRTIVFVLILGALPLRLSASTVDLFSGWTITYQNQNLSNRFNALWKKLDLPDAEEVALRYQTHFEFKADPESRSVHYLLIPPSWMPYQVYLNGHLISDSGSSAKSISRIFATQFIAIPVTQLTATNELTFEVQGAPLLGGFRSDEILLTDNPTVLRSARLKTFLMNDINIWFLFCSLLLGLFGFMVHFKLRGMSYKYLYLGIASLTIIPYHLLTTNFYSYFNLSVTAPFRIQLFFQVISWLFWGVFFLSSQEQQTKVNYFQRLSYSLSLFFYVILVGVAAITFPYKWYSSVIIPVFLIPMFLGTYWLMNLARQRKTVFFLAIIGILAGQLSLLSEFLNLNIYLIGLTTTLFGLIGCLIFLTEYFNTSEQNKSSNEFLSQLLPIPIKDEVHTLLTGGASKEEILQKLRGDGTLTNIFVDICSFGKLTRELASKTVYETRLFVFNYIAEILIQRDIHFIKPVGDSMHFCGGILLHRRPSQTRISTACIYGVVDILDAIAPLNEKLKAQNLPEVKLKISATIGHCEFGFEGTSTNLRFDVQGHWVNITKRFEDHMDAKFYESYGQNVALISENLFKFSEDIQLRKRFLNTFKVTDKDGKTYEALIGQQYPEVVTDQDMLEAIYGQFSHGKNTRNGNHAA